MAVISPQDSATSLDALHGEARRLRCLIVDMTTAAGSGHPSSSFSCVELLTALFFVFQAPDVALSEIVVSTVWLPVMILLAVRKVREDEREREEEEQ